MATTAQSKSRRGPGCFSLRENGWFTCSSGKRKEAESANGDLVCDNSIDGNGSAIQELEPDKLVFFEEKGHTFDVEDLLRASAEVLGKGRVGTAYRAVLADGNIVVVKRLRDVTSVKQDFETHVQSIGRLRHRNLVPLRAYYFSGDDKLLVYNYMPSGNLSALLHGPKGSSRLDWITRIRIATGAGRGLAFLHNQAFIHGNIKSSNVLLTRELEACMSDFGLSKLLISCSEPWSIVGCRAPEVSQAGQATVEADVYSFGLLLLELLTGRAPNQATVNNGVVDLARWVQLVSKGKEALTTKVYDLELQGSKNIEEDMFQMLQIAMQCVTQVPDQRPSMNEVVKMLENFRQPYSKYSGKELDIDAAYL